MIKAKNNTKATDIYLPKKYPSIQEIPTGNYLVLKEIECLESVVETFYTINTLMDVMASYIELKVDDKQVVEVRMKIEEELSLEVINKTKDTLSKEHHSIIDSIETMIHKEKTCITMFHTGDLFSEKNSITIMESFMRMQGYKRVDTSYNLICLSYFKEDNFQRIISIEIKKITLHSLCKMILYISKVQWCSG